MLVVAVKVKLKMSVAQGFLHTACLHSLLLRFTEENQSLQTGTLCNVTIRLED